MAKCDEGYLCEVCEQPVEGMINSALYLQYVIGWIDPETLHTRRECHLTCLPTLSQFIEDDRFESVRNEGEFDRRTMDQEFVRERTELVTRGYQRLWELQTKRRGLAVTDYPLPDVAERWRASEVNDS